MYAENVELIVVAEITHFRILANKNLKVLGPLTLDAEPLALTQGTLLPFPAFLHFLARADDLTTQASSKTAISFDLSRCTAVMQPCHKLHCRIRIMLFLTST